MDQARLSAILEEKAKSPGVYKADGWKYFEEALPIIEQHIIKKAAEKAEVKKTERKSTK